MIQQHKERGGESPSPDMPAGAGVWAGKPVPLSCLCNPRGCSGRRGFPKASHPSGLRLHHRRAWLYQGERPLHSQGGRVLVPQTPVSPTPGTGGPTALQCAPRGLRVLALRMPSAPDSKINPKPNLTLNQNRPLIKPDPKINLTLKPSLTPNLTPKPAPNLNDSKSNLTLNLTSNQT